MAREVQNSPPVVLLAEPISTCFDWCLHFLSVPLNLFSVVVVLVAIKYVQLKENLKNMMKNITHSVGLVDSRYSVESRRYFSVFVFDFAQC